MSRGEELYLVLVVVSAIVFAATLAWASWNTKGD